MATNPVYQVLDDLGTQEFMNVILTIVDEYFTSYTTRVVDGDHNRDDRMPTSQASLTLANQVNTVTANVRAELGSVSSVIEETRRDIHRRVHLTFQTVTGPISSITNPRGDVVYLQHDSSADITWVVYVYNNGWISVGDFTKDFANYWSKDNTDADVTEFGNKIFEFIDRDSMRKDLIDVWLTISDEEDLYNTYRCKMDKWNHELSFTIPTNQDVILRIDNNGELILLSNDSLADKALECYQFKVEDDTLYCTIDMNKG